jgi:hypothetical protein
MKILETFPTKPNNPDSDTDRRLTKGFNTFTVVMSGLMLAAVVYGVHEGMTNP